MQASEWIKINYNIVKQHPCARWGHSSLIVNSKLYIMGGYADSQYMNDLWEFDFQSNQWKMLEFNGLLPEPRSNHTMHLDNQNIYIYGGGGQQRARYGDLWSLDLQNRKWKKIQCGGQLPTPRTYHSTCMENGKLFIYGGECVEDLDSLIVLDLRTFNYLNVQHYNERPQTRRFSSMNCLEIDNEPTLVLLGGCTPSYTPCPQIFLAKIKDESNNQISVHWQKMKDFFFRWGHTAQVYKNSLWIFGGRNKEDLTDLVEIKFRKDNAEIKTWNQSSNIKSRRKHTAEIIGNSMVIFGGFNGEYHSDLQFIEIPYDFFNSDVDVHRNFKYYLQFYKELGDLIFYSNDQKDFIIVHKFIFLNFIKMLNSHSLFAQQIIIDKEIILPKVIDFIHFKAFIKFVYNDTILNEDISYFQQIKNIINLLFEDTQELEDNFFFQNSQTAFDSAQTLLSSFLITEEDNNQLSYVLKCSQQYQSQAYLSLISPWTQYKNVSLVTQDNKLFEINKMIFSCQSGFFREMFTQNFREFDQEIIQLNGIFSNDFNFINCYLHSGFIVIQKECDALQLIHLLELAIYLDIPHLVEKLVRLITQRINSSNIVEVYLRSIELSIIKLQEVCSHLILELNNGLTTSPLQDSTNLQFKSEKQLMEQQINQKRKERILYLMYKSNKKKVLSSSSKKENQKRK